MIRIINKIVRVNDFTHIPSCSKKSGAPDDSNSGKLFRESILLPILKKTEGVILIDFDGTAGVPNIFIEEAIGDLITVDNYSATELENYLVIKSNEMIEVIEGVNQIIRERSEIAFEAKFGKVENYCQK